MSEALGLAAGNEDGQIGAQEFKLMKDIPAIFGIQVQIQQNDIDLLLVIKQNRFTAGRGAEYSVVFG